MSRTKRKVHPYHLMWLDRVYINPITLEPEKDTYQGRIQNDRSRRGQDGIGYGELRISDHTDRHGNIKRNGWDVVWGRTSNRLRTNRQQRIADQIKCKLGYQDYLDAQEDTGKQFNWLGYDLNGSECWYEQLQIEEADFYEQQEYEEDLRIMREIEEHDHREAEAWFDDYYNDPYYEEYYA